MAKVIDWEIIESDYRAGVKTLRVIADECGISHGAINKRAKRDGWERDLSHQIKKQAAALVSKSVSTDAVSNGILVSKRTGDKAIIEANAQLIAGIQISHRQDIPRKKELVSKLFAEIEAQTDNKDLIEQLIKALKKNDDKTLAGIAQKMASLPQRIKGVSDLVAAYKSLIGLEREAFGLNDAGASDPNAPDSISITFRRVTSGNMDA